MNSSKTLLAGNTIALLIVFTVNAMAILLPINGISTKEISDLYPSLFTPAGFTFSVWSVIYLLLVGFIVAQFRINKENYFKELSRWFLLSCFANASWILAWHYLFTATSVVFMLVLLYTLVNIFTLLQRSKMKIWVDYIFIKLPFIFYLSWICVATMANISVVLISLNWRGGFLSPEYWTILMIFIAAVLGLFIAYRFKEPTFLLVLMWACFGIYSRWIGTEHEIVALASIISVVVLAVMFVLLIVASIKQTASA